MHTELHWLDVPERINYKLGMLMYRCQLNKAPRYLMDHCTSVSDVAYRQRLRFVLPVVMKSLFHGTGSVPMDVGHLPLLTRLSETLCPRTCGIRMFLRTVTGSHWRRFYFRSTSVFSALEVFYENALHKFTFDIDKIVPLEVTLWLKQRYYQSQSMWKVRTMLITGCSIMTLSQIQDGRRTLASR